MKNEQTTRQCRHQQQHVVKKKEIPLIARLLRCTAVIAITAAFLLVGGEKNNMLTPIPARAIDNGAIQGHKIDQNESLSALATTITIITSTTAAIGSFTDNPYTSGLIMPGIYMVSSSQPSGYSVSYSTNPDGGASTYVSGTSATVTVTAGQTVNLWWKYSPVAGTSAIQGSRIDQNGTAYNLASTITISGVGSFTANPYNSGTIVPGTYTVTSSQPSGYSVSYSTNPGGGASTYVSGSTATVTVLASQTVILWWKYTPIITTSIQGYRVNQNNTLSSVGAAITIAGVGSFTDNPYNSGQISPGTYTVSSSQPSGYSVSYSTNPTGGHSTYISGTIATVTVTAGRNLILWWKYTPIAAASTKGTIQGSMVDQNGSTADFGSTITISGVGSFTGSSYKSSDIPTGTYSVSSSQPADYTVSYSTNLGGGASTYTAGTITTVTVTAGQTVNLWWKYTPITSILTTGAIQGYKVDQNGQLTDAGKTATITINGVGSFTNNPYDSGKITPTSYTVTSSQPDGYTVSYSTNPAGGSSTYVSGSTATVTVTDSGTVTLWWKYSPITGVIQGTKVDENGQPSLVLSATPITIYGVGTFINNPYTSGKIVPHTYTISSAEPAGYSVSYSINPGGGASTYVSGSTAIVDVKSGLTVNVWWKYTPIADLSNFNLELDNLRSSYSPAVITHKEIRRMWTGSLTNNFSPAIHSILDLSTIPRADKIFYSEYINGAWTKPFPQRTFQKSGFQINDPAIIKHPYIDSLIFMYYTALADTDADQKIFDRHKIGFAMSSDGRQVWQDKGIVIDYPESGDGKGASSPSAIVVGDEIWVYYHTGASDFSKPIDWRIRFDINSFGTTKIGLPEQLNITGFIPNNPNWTFTNLDISYRNSQFVMLANTSDLTKIVRLVSDDGINWRKPAAGPDPMIEIPNYLVLTPTVEDISPDRYKIYFGLGAISGSNVESSMIRSREFSTSASTPISASAFVFTTDMTIGDTGDNVRALQTCLKKDSSIYPEGLITGYFGPLTRKAVIRFQEKFAIDATGFVGLLTRTKLNQVCAA